MTLVRALPLALLAWLGAPALVAAQQDDGSVGVYASKGPEVGATAPEFALPWATAALEGTPRWPFTLWKTRGHAVVMAFVTSDTAASSVDLLRTFRDRRDELFAPGVLVVTVSTDLPAILHEVAARESVPFTLLSDTDQKVATAYGAAGRNGRNRRVVVVIDPAGRVAYKDEQFLLTPRAYEALKQAVARARGF